MQILSKLLTPILTSKILSKFKVFSLPAGFSGCAFWRFRLPIQEIMKHDERKCDFLIADNPDKMIRLEEIERHASECQIVSLQAPGAMDAFKLMRMYKFEGRKVVIDYDDFSFDLDPGNPRYADLGIKECEGFDDNGNLKYRWRDGENGFDLKSNLSKFEAFKTCVKHADLVTTTTDLLANKFREINSKVAIVPNTIDLKLWKPLPKRNDGFIRIGWVGGDSHYADLKLFKKIMPPLLAKYPKLKIALQCPNPPLWKDIFDSIPPDRMEWHGWADLKFYTIFLANRDMDIGLCPLDPNMEFNIYKSCIKWLEYSALGAATVAQNMPPYSVEIKHNQTGLLASTPYEWIEQIGRLIESEELRRHITESAFMDVSRRFSLDNEWRVYDDTYAKLLS